MLFAQVVFARDPRIKYLHARAENILEDRKAWGGQAVAGGMDERWDIDRANVSRLLPVRDTFDTLEKRLCVLQHEHWRERGGRFAYDMQ